MQIKSYFTTTAARLAYVCLDEDLGESFQDYEDGETYQCVKKSAGAGSWRSISDIDATAVATAQTTANTGVTNAATAQTQANTATTNAATAQASANSALAMQAAPRVFGASRLLPIVAGMILISDKAYWQYLGYFPAATTIKRVRFHIVTSGVGTQAAEVLIGSTPAAPNRAAQVVTKIAAQAIATLDLTAVTGLQTNDSDINAAIPAATHAWVGIRTAMSVTQPILLAVANDMGQGEVLSTATAGVLTAAGPFTGATITSALTAIAPLLTATKD